MGNLIGNAKVIGTSTDDVVRTIQALIAAGYKGEALLDKIDEIYGVGARNNLLKVVDYELPQEGRTVVIEYPQISPNEKTKIGDVLIGSNGYIGRITALEIDSDNLVSSATILGLDYNIIQDILPAITTDDNYKVLTVKDGVWLKDYINRTNNSLDLYGNDSNGYFKNSDIIFNDRYIDGSASQDRTNRSITIEPTFVPYTAEDISLSLRFYDDDDRDIRLTGIRLPKNDTDVANKNYVDNHTPLFVVFSGTTEAGNASCDTDWATILSAINSGRPIHARYLGKSYDDSNIYYDLSLNYSNAGLSGNYLFIEDLSNPASTYDKIDVTMTNNHLYIYFTSV